MWRLVQLPLVQVAPGELVNVGLLHTLHIVEDISQLRTRGEPVSRHLPCCPCLTSVVDGSYSVNI